MRVPIGWQSGSHNYFIIAEEVWQLKIYNCIILILIKYYYTSYKRKHGTHTYTTNIYSFIHGEIQF